MMKILIIRPFPNKLKIHSYNVQELGLAKALVRRGHECDIVFFNGYEKSYIQYVEVDNYDSNKNIKVYHQKALRLFNDSLFFGLKKIIKDYDIIQVHEYFQIQSWIAYSFWNKPVIVYHGPYYSSFTFKSNIRTFLFDLIFLSIKLKKDTPIITKSNLAKDFILSKKFTNVTTLGVGLDSEKLTETTTEVKLFDREEGCFYLLYVGVLSDTKNIMFTIDLLYELVKSNIKVKLVIVGKGKPKYQAKVENIITKKNLSKNIIYFESITQDVISNVYNSCDIFLLPSRYEIFGMVLLEAMYFGLPTLTTLNGGSSTIIENNKNGFILDTNDIRKWIDVITKLITDKEYYDFVSFNAKKDIEEKFFWDNLVDKFICEYGKCVNKYQCFN